jgi:hypothetical protein
MRFIGLLVACLVVIAAGTALGTVPIIKENLHWNFFFVIPISGFALGMAFGWIQFQIGRFSGARVGGLAAAMLALACTVGYLGSDYGQYATIAVSLAAAAEPEPGVEGETADKMALPEGQVVPLSELMTFEEFMRARLESSSIDMRPGSTSDATVEVGTTAATVSFFADLLGAWLGAFGALVFCAERHPYCRRCARYKKGLGTGEIPLEQDLANETVDRLQERFESGSYQDVVSLLEEIAKQPRPAETSIKIATDERVCPSCNEATLICRVMTLKGKDDWNEALDLRVSSSSGSTARFSPTA